MGKLVINEGFLQQVEILAMHIKDNVAGLFGGNHKTKTHGSSCEFDDFRDYVAGDDVTKIDWNAYARFDKLFLKLYLDERQVHTRIYIDASRSMDFGKCQKAEMALKIAATIAYISIGEMDKVSIYAVRDDKVEEVVTNVVGKDAYLSVINKLNEIEFYGECRISEALLPERVGYGDGLSVIISDFLTDNNYEDAIDYLVSKKRHTMCIQVLSREELNPMIRGKVHFFDSEDSDKFYRKNIDRDIAKAYKMALEAIVNRIRDYCMSRGADYLLAPDDASLAELFFGQIVDMGVLK